MNRLKGFTMAEMVITMGILGIVAVMVLPVLNNSRPNEEMIMLKKSYHNTARVVSELINDDDLYPEYDDSGVQSGFANTAKAIYNGKEYSAATKFCQLFAAKLNATSVDCSARKALSAKGNFTTADGVVWSMPVSNFGSTQYIAIDTNGSKINNCSTQKTETYGSAISAQCSGSKAPDQFIIKVNKFGAISVVGKVEKEYITSNKISRSYADTKACVKAGNCNNSN